MVGLVWLLSGCGGAKDTGAAVGVDDTAAVCDEANEDCAPGTCGGEGAWMLPGANCLACHAARRSGAVDDEGEDEGDDDAPIFSVGGTAFADLAGSGPLAGATIRVTDATGTTVTLTTNDVGNFYSRDPLTPPLSAEIEVGGDVRSMSAPVETGGCNSCHACDGAAGGKLTGP